MSPLLRDASLSTGSGSAGSASLCMDSGEMLRLLRAHDAHQAQHRLRAREDLHEPRPALYLTAHALLNVVAACAPAVLRGEVEVGQGVGLGPLEERTRAGRQHVHRVDGSPVGRPRGGGVRLAEDGLHRPGRHRPMALGGQQGANVALEVDDAALPAGGRQALGDRACEASVGVADDEADAREPALAGCAGSRANRRRSRCRPPRYRVCGARRRSQHRSRWRPRSTGRGRPSCTSHTSRRGAGRAPRLRPDRAPRARRPRCRATCTWC